MRRRCTFAAGALALALASCGSTDDTVTLRNPSPSMAPTLRAGAKLVVHRHAYRTHDPARGDIVVLHPPRGAAQLRCGARGEGRPPGTPCGRATRGTAAGAIVKRIVGLPGDRVAVPHGHVLVDGRRVAEPYARPCTVDQAECDFSGSVRVPAGSYYVLGDNRPASADSRFWGPVTRAQIVGRVDPP